MEGARKRHPCGEREETHFDGESCFKKLKQQGNPTIAGNETHNDFNEAHTHLKRGMQLIETETATEADRTKTDIHDANEQYVFNVHDMEFEKTSQVPKTIQGFNPRADRSKNIIHIHQQSALGRMCPLQVQKKIKTPTENIVSGLKLCSVRGPFDNSHITVIEWHPTKPNILLVGDDNGQITVIHADHEHRYKTVMTNYLWTSPCNVIKFWPGDNNKVLVDSMNGTIKLNDIETNSRYSLADDNLLHSEPDVLFTDHYADVIGMDANTSVVAAGDDRGYLQIISIENRDQVFRGRLHKKKITHVEFSPRESWMMCTASVDKTVRIWDVRMLKDAGSSITELEHDNAVSSAYFSKTDGCRLLTTDQNNEIRVYVSPSWLLQTTIFQPHRRVPKLSFKATWHPLHDVIVCGRHPDAYFPSFETKDVRSIDMFDADTGAIITRLHWHHSRARGGNCCLNKFNSEGDTLATGLGSKILLWRGKRGKQHFEVDYFDRHRCISYSSKTSSSLNCRCKVQSRRKKGLGNTVQLRNFLNVLAKSTSTQPAVCGLIQDLIDSKIDPTLFITSLRETTNLNLQEYLVLCLEKWLPKLRKSLSKKKITIYGIRPSHTRELQQNDVRVTDTVSMNTESQNEIQRVDDATVTDSVSMNTESQNELQRFNDATVTETVLINIERQEELQRVDDATVTKTVSINAMLQEELQRVDDATVTETVSIIIERQEELQRVEEELVHSYDCRVANCPFNNCLFFDGVFEHVRTCKVDRLNGISGCSVCNQFAGLWNCTNNTCQLPWCRDMH